MDTPLLTVETLAYNHAPYIRQCIEGILMQKTTFPFELLIHDDASPDGTADIIREYETRYPDIIKPIYQTENQNLKKGHIADNILLSRTRGKYTAVCEGDDYWTDPLKLQKQVDFLETHLDYTICGARVGILYPGNTDTVPDWMTDMSKYPKGKTISLDDFLEPFSFHLQTICYRTDCFGVEKLNLFEYLYDQTYFAILLEQGKGFVFPDYFGVYRVHQGGAWSGKTYEEQQRFSEPFFYEMVQHFGSKSKSIRKRYFEYCINLRFIELRESKQFIIDCLKIVRFAFLGKIRDVISFQIPYLFHKSRQSFIRIYK